MHFARPTAADRLMTQDVLEDHDRERRIGLPEAVFCAGKSVGQIARIAEARGHAPSLFTRLAEEQYASLPAALRGRLDYDPVSRTAFLGTTRAPEKFPRIAIVAAGTSDLPVIAEVERTLAFHGEGSVRLADVGVAGLWRLVNVRESLDTFPVVVAVAGMEGALFSVLGGLVGGLIIAVPTSVGYGVSAQGRVALDSALASCAPGVVTVNIDNGYGGACAALRAIRARSRSR